MTDAALVDEELGLKQAKATSSYGAADEDQRRTGPVRSHAAAPRPGQHVRDVLGRHAQEVILDVRTPLPSSFSRPTTLTFFYVYFDDSALVERPRPCQRLVLWTGFVPVLA